MPIKPFAPRLFSASDLQALEAKAAELMKTRPTDAQNEAFAASLVQPRGHVAAAEYDPGLRRINVSLADGTGFPLALPNPPPNTKATGPSAKDIEAEVAREGGTAKQNADGSITATFPART